MFKIDRSANRIQPLSGRSFSELGFREREHLQEWIVQQPDCLGEPLLIIQKEFSGFDGTSERLDVLALDRNGQIVVIENKLDDSGRDVVWQAMKYASYCWELRTDQIVQVYQRFLDTQGGGDARARIAEFLDASDVEQLLLNKGASQRIILIAARFRREVTSTVLWLRNFKLQIQCIKVTPHALGDDLFLSFDQIIPVRDTQDLMIGLVGKAEEELEVSGNERQREQIYRAFWGQLVPVLRQRSSRFTNVNTSNQNWISSNSRGIGHNLAVSGNYGRAEIYIDTQNGELNKMIFDQLFASLASTPEASGLVWERLDHRRASRIKLEGPGNIYDRETWPDMISFMVEAMVKLENLVVEPLRSIHRS
ncbi:DUF4268 domain-containing protein [Sandarakinorhabdus oryzae]|uniref:DUF4268 domain-containing protein n=1 Tax=Sandarakinorhabdus oryzae TaxID=2675220 RepID=UPI0012E25115|nr:DUF4268 domain-containing protein [Sandarakinorhabdus oryzae]